MAKVKFRFDRTRPLNRRGKDPKECYNIGDYQAP